MIILLTGALALAGCGGPLPEAPSEPPPPVAEEPEELMALHGISLYLTQTDATPGVARKPALAVHAEGFTMEAGNVWLLEEAEARAYAEDGTETIYFHAGKGRFDDTARVVELEAGVQAKAGALEIDMDQVRWYTPEGKIMGMAEAKGQSVVRKEGVRIEASGLRLKPAEDTFELDNLRGTIALEDLAQ